MTTQAMGSHKERVMRDKFLKILLVYINSLYQIWATNGIKSYCTGRASEVALASIWPPDLVSLC
jgi:hypothetical protein